MTQPRLSLNISQEPHARDITFVKHVGSTVKKYRMWNNLEINDLSTISGLANDVISGLEEGAMDIYLNDLLSIAKALGISALDLVEMPPPENRQQQRI